MSSDKPIQSTPSELLREKAQRLSECYISLGRLTVELQDLEEPDDKQLNEEIALEKRIEDILDEVPQRLILVHEAARVTIEAILYEGRTEMITPEEQTAMHLASV